ncbi:MAG: scyllo-inositol 2-dehydrogenase [Alphaproteobacteria bacterium]|jgi:predicted dehydrogenase|nr:scyllo-inositol 2-dehydrogenase [Alphaproteobacteria bacterium]
MRLLIVGYGVQGKKRFRVAGADAVGVVDPVAPEANWRDIHEAPTECYDAALVCTPDEPKSALLHFLLGQGKHVLVEKPLHAEGERDLVELEALARKTGAVCYTAYNHRFEPHYVRMRELVRSGELGRIYRCRMFYGNGTARLVRDSAWRDQGAGVLPDLGSHLLDTARFWFGDLGGDFDVTSASRFENRAPDHVVVASESTNPKLEFEMTLLSWRNHFTCDVLAENGTAHIESLCKWGPTTFTHRSRVLPSGRPKEESVTLVQEDPTWAIEYQHFKRLAADRIPTDLSNDRWLLRILGKLSTTATTASVAR